MKHMKGMEVLSLHAFHGNFVN